MKVQDLKALQLLLKNEMDFDSICKCFPGYRKTTNDSTYPEGTIINSESAVMPQVKIYFTA